MLSPIEDYKNYNLFTVVHPPIKNGNKYKFIYPYDICAAGFIPFIEYKGERLVVVQAEQNKKTLEKHITAFSGKVEENDQHWLDTAFREFDEESGGVLCDKAYKNMQQFCMIQNNVKSCYYSRKAKAQFCFYRVPQCDMGDWFDIGGNYAKKFEGSTNNDRKGLSLIVVNINTLLEEEFLPLRKDLKDALYNLKKI